MNAPTQLTHRENQIAGLISTGMAKKEVADLLKLSTYTVETIVKNIYEKTGLGKINELTGWWLIRELKLDIDLKEMRQQILMGCFALLICFSGISNDQMQRGRRMRRVESYIESYQITFDNLISA